MYSCESSAGSQFGPLSGGTYLAGRNSVNVLPLPSVLSTRISPPSRRAISRLMESPSPVPPYLRLVVPSACWNASKIRRCFSFGIPTPVSATANARTSEEFSSTGFRSEERRVGKEWRGEHATQRHTKKNE